MPITDLTGYTWVGNNYPDGTTLGSFSINFTSNNSNYDAMDYQSKWDGICYYNDGNRITAYSGDTGWADNAYKTIQITGGTDVTNANLIAWLEANGTLTAPQTSFTKRLNWRNINFDIHHIPVYDHFGWFEDALGDVYVCENCRRPLEVRNIVVPAYTAATSLKAQMNSSQTADETLENGDADYNICFDNARTADGGSDYGFTLTLNIKHDNPISSMKNNFWINVGNDKIYAFSGGTTGKTKAYFYTDLSWKGTNNSSNLTTSKSNNDKMYILDAVDNRADYTPIGASFEADYCAFTQDCTYVFDVDYTIRYSEEAYGNGNYGFITVIVTYYPKVEGYEQYLGYHQTFTARLRKAETSWTGSYTGEVNYATYATFKVGRVLNDFNTTITAGDTPIAYTVTKGTLKTQSGKTNPLFKDTW